MNPCYRNTYLTEVPTTAARIETDEAGNVLLTVRDMAFHPGGGGHPKDRGTVEIHDHHYPVLDLVKGNGDVQIVLGQHQALREKLTKGNPILQHVDRERRLQAARLHSLQHTFGAAARIITADSEYTTGGMTIADDLTRCEMRFGTIKEIAPKQVDDMTDLVCSAITANLSVNILTIESVDAARDVYGPVLRIDPSLSFKGNRLRLVTIGERDSILQDASLCGGNHVTALGEVGTPQILDFAANPERREYYLCFALI